MEMYYSELGEGPPLFIIHGLYGSSDNWMKTAKALSGRFRVYSVDLRNHGRSPHSDVHNYEVMRDDLLELLDKLSVKKATLLGHSMGGKVAVCFAGHYPDRVEQLIVADIAPVSYSGTDREKEGRAYHAEVLEAMMRIDIDSSKSRAEADRKLSETVENRRIRQFLLKNLKRNKDKSFGWRINLDVLKRELDNIMDGINESCPGFRIPVTGFPVLFIRGERSSYIKDEDFPAIRKIFPQAEIITLPGAGHWLHAEKPGEFVRNILGFTFS